MATTHAYAVSLTGDKKVFEKRNPHRGRPPGRCQLGNGGARAWHYGYSSPEVQEKVRAAAATLGYRPNRLAKGLITGKTQTIGVVVGDIESPFYASVLRGIGDVARRGGFGVIVTNSDENAELEREAVQLLLEKQVDGLIVSSTCVDEPDHLREAISRSTARSCSSTASR